MRLLEHLHRVRLLDRAQLQRLEFTPAATSACKRRLTLLYHHGFVDRRYALSSTPFGAARAAYYLDRKGGQLLAGRTGTTLEALGWRRDDMDRDLLFLAHLLDTNDVFISFHSSLTGRRSRVDWTSERDLRRLLTGVRLPASPRTARTELVPIPDAYVTLLCPDPYAFAIELDRGTVDESRIRRKIVAYGEWISTGAYRAHLPDTPPRVLFVVSAGAASRARLDRLARWCLAEGGGSLFWFAEHGDVRDGDPISDRIWAVSGEPGKHRLIPDAPVAVRLQRVRPPRIR